MFKKASDACDMLARNFQLAGYEPGESTWRDLRKGVKRDLQARGLRPNVSVPSRRHIFAYLRTMWRETGSVTQTVQSYLHDGSWTSSGGSFLLAERLGYDLPAMIAESLDRGEKFRLLEIGGGWAGFKNPPGDARDIAGLSRRFSTDCGSRLHLHFTNLTPWHAGRDGTRLSHRRLVGAYPIARLPAAHRGCHLFASGRLLRDGYCGVPGECLEPSEKRWPANLQLSGGGRQFDALRRCQARTTIV